MPSNGIREGTTFHLISYYREKESPPSPFLKGQGQGAGLSIQRKIGTDKFPRVYWDKGKRPWDSFFLVMIRKDENEPITNPLHPCTGGKDSQHQ